MYGVLAVGEQDHAASASPLGLPVMPNHWIPLYRSRPEYPLDGGYGLVITSCRRAPLTHRPNHGSISTVAEFPRLPLQLRTARSHRLLPGKKHRSAQSTREPVGPGKKNHTSPIVNSRRDMRSGLSFMRSCRRQLSVRRVNTISNYVSLNRSERNKTLPLCG